jgi:hypothetical protein
VQLREEECIYCISINAFILGARRAAGIRPARVSGPFLPPLRSLCRAFPSVRGMLRGAAAGVELPRLGPMAQPSNLARIRYISGVEEAEAEAHMHGNFN